MVVILRAWYSRLRLSLTPRPVRLLMLLVALAAPARALIQVAEVDGPERGQLQDGVDAAIDRGVAFLLGEQNRDGSWGPASSLQQALYFDHAFGQTALSIYTLLKCKLPPDHPSIVRGFTYLLTGMPSRTYSIGCQLMALSATGDPVHRERIESLLELLLDQSNSTKGISWGYQGGAQQTPPDLSNTQFGVLGLRAAERAGVAVSPKIWREVMGGVLRYQSEPEKLEHPTLGKLEVAPFRYKIIAGPGSESLSMTAAGIAVLSICEEALADTSARKTLRKLEQSRAPALNWLEVNFSIEKNVSGGLHWLYYYLYGLERVGSLLGRAEFGGHDWYLEGARFLLKAQHSNGSWNRVRSTEEPPAPLSCAKTCFALLFLTRSTASEPLSGKTLARSGAFRSEGPGAVVKLRGTSGPELTAWLTGFDAGLLRVAGTAGVLVSKVEWHLDGELVASLPGTSDTGWANERYPLRVPILRNGEHTLEARVNVELPGGARFFSSGPVTVVMDDVLEPWMLEYAQVGSSSSIATNKPKLSASSELSLYYTADMAFDGLQMSAWIAAADDARPTLTLELRKPFRVRRLLIAQVNSNPGARGRYARAERIEILVNKSREPLVLELLEDELRKSEFVFPKATKIHTLKITIVRKSTESELPSTGFAEIELLAD